MERNAQKIGIVLMNTGTPASPDPRDIRSYLIEFLSDRYIIRVPRPIWQPILHGIIARTRPKKTAPRYQAIWTEEGTPLIVETFKQRDALNQRFEQANLPLVAEVGMRYGSPSVDDALAILAQKGCTEIVGFPLFPQTATCTTTTCVEHLKQAVAKWSAGAGAVLVSNPTSTPADNQLSANPTSAPLKLRTLIRGYADNPLYPQALANSINDHWQWQPGSKLLFSLHSVPLSDVAAGDAYLDEAQRSLAKTAELLGISKDDWSLAYHSKFEDSRKWASPHPKEVLKAWADQGVTRVALATPGFAADCLESLYDIALVAKDFFVDCCAQKGNDAEVTYVPALNSRTDHIDLLFDVITKSLQK